MGLQNVGVGFVFLPEETLEFIVVAFLGSGEGPVKSEGISGEASRKEMRTGVGSQSDPIGKRRNGLKLCKKVFDIGKTCEGWREKA